MPKFKRLPSTPSLFLAIVLAVNPVQVLSQEDPVVDPKVIEILESANKFLAAQDTISVNWFASQDTVVDGREKVTQTRSGFNLISRDVGFFSYTESGLKTREFYFDRENFRIVDVGENAYVSAPFDGSFEALVERVRAEYDVVLPIWSVLSNRPSSELLDGAEAAAYLGTTRIAGREAYHLALSDYDGDWQVWISTDPDRPELLMLVGTDPYTQGWPQYRVFFSDWNFSPEIEDGAFTYVPDEDAEPMSWPKTGEFVRPKDTLPGVETAPVTTSD